MTVPSVEINQLDGALGIMPPSIGDNVVVIGTSSSGTANQPAAFAKIADVQTAFGAGPLVELMSYLIQKTGKAIIGCKAATVTSGGYGTVYTGNTSGGSFGGSCVVSMDAGTEPYDEYEPYIVFVTAGTVGVAGITYQYSLDHGRTLSAVTALGTATSVTIAEGNVKFILTSSTVTVGDYAWCRTTPPTEDAASILSATDAITTTALVWDFAVYANTATALQIAAIDTWMAYLWGLKKHKKALCNVRGPTVGETEAAYLASLTSALSSTTSIYTMACGGYCLTTSAISGRSLRRPAAWAVAARAASKSVSSPGISLAKVRLGPLPSDVQLHDQNGNPVEHDEAINPGLDDIRLCCLRTIEGLTGVYINLPRMIAPTGSDFSWWHYRGVANRAADAMQVYFVQRLQEEIRVDRRTGYILERDALDIEAGANAALKTAILTVPDASSAECVVSRTDNLISTGTLHADVRIVPLAYPISIVIDLGFDNPASRLTTA